MIGLILAAGLGTRLRPLTYFKPKCMIDVGGKPVLQHIIDHMHSHGIFDITVNLHYKPEQIMKYFGNKIRYIYESRLLGEEGTIQVMNKYQKNEYMVVMNGDTLTNVDITAMFKMSKGKNIKYMDGDVYAGTRIVRPDYQIGDNSVGFWNSEAFFQDIGTHAGLKKARGMFK